MTQNNMMQNQSLKTSDLNQVKINGEKFLKITNSDELRPFFMSIVSDSNHWMFIASNGGLTAGRRNSDYALFPYYTDDKITESAQYTGSKTIIRVLQTSNKQDVWEPFSNRFVEHYEISRHIYKNIYGNKLIFEEINHSLNLKFSYQWSSSDQYGFVRTANLENLSEQPKHLELVDGLQNILPAGVVTDLQTQSSNLVDAYKRNELDQESGLGIYALSAVPVDKAEPSEALKANVVWSIGITKPKYLLSSLQLENFRHGKTLTNESDVKAEKGAYFIYKTIELEPNEVKNWMIVADVNYNHSAVVKLQQELQKSNLESIIKENVELGTKKLIQINAAADGLQRSNDNLRDIRHYANTMFNVMRGGIFDNNYTIELWDFKTYLKTANKEVFSALQPKLNTLPEEFNLQVLSELIEDISNNDFKRLATEYLPLKFSRRHGDPSRPWNKFSINTKDDDGNKILDYEGNWRDIFQNWESLAHSYPQFIEGMIFKFLNATTFDGYNPYRVTKDGFDWETIEPDDPWSYIGYWGDHQIIYLLKFLEFIEDYKTGHLNSLFNQNLFVYANVPYKIKPYQDILRNPKDTIDFDHDADLTIRSKRNKLGADGALLVNQEEHIVRVNLMEKLLATVLAKLSNFIPEAGIWMNTQRPEWNDANNALVGNGVSMVTLAYLRRFLSFLEKLVDKETQNIKLSRELADFFNHMHDSFRAYSHKSKTGFTDLERKQMLDEIGQEASAYRTQVYSKGFTGQKASVTAAEIKTLIKDALQLLEQAITKNKRQDNLYHAYNLMSVKNNSVVIDNLEEMLEGQVAVLSSGFLSPTTALQLLDALKQSKLFREDQYSYLLYPNKKLKGFLDRNSIPEKAVKTSQLLQHLVEENHVGIIQKDVNGDYHFNGNFNNANKLKEALLNLENEDHKRLVEIELNKILSIYEDEFNHKAFTGRSGTFYGYEGLGSIYWHMVSKLQLAVLETCLKAINLEASEEVIGRLLEHYYEINAGIGVHKSPQLYGAFPTDPYSHTPQGKGAQQPGMTGQVKEDILSRFGELGVFIKKGELQFKPHLLRKSEFLEDCHIFRIVDVKQQPHELQLQPESLGFTFCQTPIIYTIGQQNSMTVHLENETKTINGLSLPHQYSSSLFQREGLIKKIEVKLDERILKV